MRRLLRRFGCFNEHPSLSSDTRDSSANRADTTPELISLISFPFGFAFPCTMGLAFSEVEKLAGRECLTAGEPPNLAWMRGLRLTGVESMVLRVLRVRFLGVSKTSFPAEDLEADAFEVSLELEEYWSMTASRLASLDEMDGLDLDGLANDT